MVKKMTGVEACDKLINLKISGDVIPPTWYKTIINEAGNVNYIAIALLANIVYWYRPVEDCDDAGNVVGYHTKFKADLLQKSYKEWGELFGFSKVKMQRALKLLEQLGVIKRDFRTIELYGQPVNNILYIRLNVDRLEALTYPDTGNVMQMDDVENSEVGGDDICDTPSNQICHKGITTCEQAPIRNGQYTKNTTENTARNTTENVSEEEGDARARAREDTVLWIREAVCYGEYDDTGLVSPTASELEKEQARIDYHVAVQAIIDIASKWSNVADMDPAYYRENLRAIVDVDADLCGYLHALIVRYHARANDHSQAPVRNERNYLQQFAYRYAEQYLREIKAA